MKDAVKFPEINSRKNSSMTSTQQQFAAIIQMQQQQAQIYQNANMNSKSSAISEQKEQMNTSANTTVDPKYDQSQVYQWEENFKKRQQNIHNISYIKSYHDAEPERPRQLYAQRSQIEGRIAGDAQNQHRGENGLQSTLEGRSGQQIQYNKQNQGNQGQNMKAQNSLSNLQDQYNVDDSDQENQHNSSKITHSNIQINYKNVQPHPLQAMNGNQDDRQKVMLVEKGMNNKQQMAEKDQKHQRQMNGNQSEYVVHNSQGEIIYQNGNNYNTHYHHQQNNGQEDQNIDAEGDEQENNEEDDEGEDGELDENDDGEDDDDDDDDDDGEDDDDEDDEDRDYPFLVLKDLISMKRNIKQQKRIIIDLAFTRYDVIKDVSDEVFGWQIQANANNRTDYNIQWIDSYVHEDDFRRMLPFQKINHFPGSQQLGKKNLLGQNLQKMRNIFPQNYNFYPITWVLPLQYEDLRMYHYQNIKRKPYYIVKPEASCQGRGIYLTSRIDQLQNTEHYVVQEYIKNPFLIDNLKFDLRLYVLIKSISPLKIFLYQEGLARFATVPYKSPNKNNVTNLMMHLTNYALNKKSPDFIQNEDSEDDDIGHKRSFSSVLKHLHNQGHDVETLMMEIRQIIVKSIISAQPQMSHMYRTCQPKNEQNEMCFEVLGFDIMLDEDLKPYLIEVNHTPSFWTDSPLDLQVKKNLIIDTLNVINVTNKTKKKYYEMRVQQQIASRSLFRKKYGPALNTGQEEFDEELLHQEYYEWEEDNMGGYLRIYPSNDDPLNYGQFLQASGSTLQDQLSRKKRFNSNQETNSNTNIFSNQQHQQIQYQLNGISHLNNNNIGNNINSNYPHHMQQQTLGSSRNQLEQQQQYHEHNYQMMMNNDQSPQKPFKVKLVNGQQQKNSGYGNMNNIPTESSNFTPIHHNHIQSQQQGYNFQQLHQQYQNISQNIYQPNGNFPNNQYKNMNNLPSGSNLTPAKLRSSIKGNTINAATQQNGMANYQITGSSYITSSAKKSQNPKLGLGDTQPQQNSQPQQQPQQFIFLDEMDGVSTFTYAEPTKPMMMNMESPSQIIKVKRNENGPTIFQQKSLVLSQPAKNINGLKLQPVDQQRSTNANNNSMNQGQIRKESQEPRKNRIASSQSFHQSSANHTLNSTNQSNSQNPNNSMSTVQNERTAEIDKNKKSLNNTSILDTSLVSQITNPTKPSQQAPPQLKNQNSNTSFKKDPQTNSSKEDELDDYQYKKSLKSAQQMQQSSRPQHQSNQKDSKNLNNSFNGNNSNQSGNQGQGQPHHHRATSLVSEKNASQIQKTLKEDMYPHNINQNLKRLNSSLQQNGDQPQQSNIMQGKIEENIYFPFGSPQTQNNKIRNKSAVNPVMVAAYSNNNNNNSYIKQNQNSYSHNGGAAPIILPNVMINNQNNNYNNHSKKFEGINNVIIPKSIEDSDKKAIKSKPKHE